MAVTPLTDLATVKLWLKIGAGAGSDPVLNQLITAVSAAIATYCNRNFGSISYTETYDGDGSGRLWLNQRPVTAVASVTVDGVTIQKRPSGQPGAFGWAFDKNQLAIQGGCFSEGFQNVVVAYTAGIAVGASATPDLWEAAAQWVSQLFKSSEHVDKVSDMMGQAGGTVYAKDMPWYVKAVVDVYAQIAPTQTLNQ